AFNRAAAKIGGVDEYVAGWIQLGNEGICTAARRLRPIENLVALVRLGGITLGWCDRLASAVGNRRFIEDSLRARLQGQIAVEHSPVRAEIALFGRFEGFVVAFRI